MEAFLVGFASKLVKVEGDNSFFPEKTADLFAVQDFMIEFRTQVDYLQYYCVERHLLLLQAPESYQTTAAYHYSLLSILYVHPLLYLEGYFEFHFFLNIFGNDVSKDVVILGI